MSLQHSLSVRGVGGTLQLTWRRLIDRGRTPSYLLSRTIDLERFDRQHGIETAEMVEMEQLDVPNLNKPFGTRYAGVVPWAFHETLGKLSIDHSRYTFIDIGSGKGAALFQASDYPFRKIIGVEYAPALHEAAVRNIQSYRSGTQKCLDISSVCDDAATWAYPEGPWVLFFNAPFGVPIWKAAAENLAKALSGQGKSYLIHFQYGWQPDAAEYVRSLEFLKLVDERENARIYEL